jgi:hypothetical protein
MQRTVGRIAHCFQKEKKEVVATSQPRHGHIKGWRTPATFASNISPIRDNLEELKGIGAKKTLM